MGTTRADIKEWLERYEDSGATHLVIVCDSFSYEDYPVPINSSKELAELEKRHRDGKNMQRIMEIYNYSLDLEKQLNEERAFNR